MSIAVIKARLLFPLSLGLNIVLGRLLNIRAWWTHIDDRVLLGAWPFKVDVKKLDALGVKAVVNTCEEYAGPVDAYALYNIDQLHLPVVDYASPTLTQIVKAIAYIEQHKNGVTYVHCKAGQGRSATVVLCWIMKTRHLGPEEALAYLMAQRPHVNRHIAQREAVLQYARQLELE